MYDDDSMIYMYGDFITYVYMYDCTSNGSTFIISIIQLYSGIYNNIDG